MPVGSRKVRSSYPRFWKHGKHKNVFVNGRQKLKLPPLEILNWIFRYDESTGKLYRIRSSNGKLCEPEREITYVSKGYLVVGITDSNGLQKWFKVHQLIYFIVSRVEPLSIVDHKDGDPLNNLFSNLRLATDSDNQRNRGMQRNNTSGVTGITWHKQTGKWQAQANDNNGKQKHLGLFIDIEEAAAVVSAWYANPELGYSERHGLNASISAAFDV